MIMKKIYNILFVFSLSFVSSVSYAQKDSTLQQSMVVERDFSPIVRDANKIDQQPQQEEIKFKKSATRYADWLAPTATSTEIGRMPAIILKTDSFNSVQATTSMPTSRLVWHTRTSLRNSMALRQKAILTCHTLYFPLPRQAQRRDIYHPALGKAA